MKVVATMNNHDGIQIYFVECDNLNNYTRYKRSNNIIR